VALFHFLQRSQVDVAPPAFLRHLLPGDEIEAFDAVIAAGIGFQPDRHEHRLAIPARDAPEKLDGLREARIYHESGRDAATLARLDPDVAQVLKIMWEPAPPETKPTRKPAGGRKR
jgi:hypothetical protein